MGRLKPAPTWTVVEFGPYVDRRRSAYRRTTGRLHSHVGLGFRPSEESHVELTALPRGLKPPRYRPGFVGGFRLQAEGHALFRLKPEATGSYPTDQLNDGFNDDVRRVERDPVPAVLGEHVTATR